MAHVGYPPGDRILGLSKPTLVVEMFAHRPRVQERPTQQAEFLALAGSSATTHDGLVGHRPVALGGPTSNDEEEQRHE